MNKTSIIAIILVALVIIAGIGYAILSNSNAPIPEVNDQTSTSSLNSSSVSALQTSSPTAKTDSITVPYISTVVVKGTVNPNGELTTYWYEYGETSALGTQTSAYLLGSGYATLYAPAYITGLKSNTSYYFRLSARNSIGTASGATYSFKTSTTPAPIAIVPTASTVSATNIAKTTANLNGQVNPKNLETTYWFEYGLTSNLGAVSILQSAGSGNASTNVSASVANLQPLTKYYFRLDAQNQFGTVNGQILNFTTAGPSAQTAPTVNTDSANAITKISAKLNASVNPNGVATTYWFEYGITSSLSGVSVINTPEQSLSNSTSAVNVSANIISLTNNTKYYVRVAAKNQYGTVRGGIESFTTKK